MHRKAQPLKTQFIKYVALNILSMLGTSCYILADTFFIANGIGANGLTALNVAISLYSFQFSIALLLAIGGATKFAVLKARHRNDEGNVVYSHTLLTGLCVSIVIALLGIGFNTHLAGCLGAEGVIVELTAEYMQVIFAFAPFIMVNQIMVAFIRNDGNPKLATVALLISNVSNIVLDYVFVYPMDMGMFGAALATALSPVICLSVLSIHIIKKHNTFHLIKAPFRVTRVLAFSRLGTSSMVNELSVGLVVMVFNLLFFGFGGDTAVAAYGVVANCAIVGAAIFTGIAQGIQPLVSHTYGQGHTKGLKQILQYAFVTAITISAVLVAAIFIFRDPIISIFNKEKDPLLQHIAEDGLCIYFLGYLAACFNIVIAGFLSAIERADFGFTVALMRGFVVIAPAAIVLSRIFGMTGIWIAVPVAEGVTLLAAIWMLCRALKSL